MKTKIIYLLLCIPAFLFAQERTVSGVVKDALGEAIPFVKVSVKNKKQSAVTDIDGAFTVSANEQDVLVFSFFTYKTKELEASEDFVEVVLNPMKNEDLNRRVTLGLGDSEKRSLTGAESFIESPLIFSSPGAAIFDGVQGNATGVKVLMDNQPGAQANVSVRGIGTLMTRGNPLYIVDGIFVDEINDINNEDIESINILKDVALLSTYGSRGANGVVLINTKRGHIGDLKVKATAHYGVKDVSSKVDMADAASLQDYTGISNTIPEEVDWFDELTSVGKVFRGNVSLSAGSQNLKTYVSAGLYNEQGLLDNEKYNRVNFSGNLDFALSSKLNFTFNGALALVNSENKPVGAFQNAYQQVPTFGIRNVDGLYNGNYGPGGLIYGDNPIGDVALYNHDNETSIVRTGINADYKVLDFLTISSGFGIKYQANLGRSFAGETELADPNHNAGETYYSENRLEAIQYNYNAYATFYKTFKENHNLSLVYGISGDYNRSTIDYGTVNQVPEAEHLWNFPIGFNFVRTLGGEPAIGGITHPTLRFQSQLAKLSYNYKGKYLFNLSGRSDSSTRFLAGTHATTYAISGGWIVSEERFLQNQSIINFLKIRAGVGEVANQRIPVYRLLSNRIIDNYIGAETPVDLDSANGYEISDMSDIGVEFTMFNSRLSGEFNYYNRFNNNAALVRLDKENFDSEIPVHPFAIDPASYFQNAAKIRNSGYEVALQWQNTVNDNFRYSLGVNFSKNKNRVNAISNDGTVQLDGGFVNGNYTKRLAVGQSVGAWYMYDAIGVNDLGEILYENRTDGTPTTDANESQKQFVGNSEADTFYGLNFGIVFKNFDLSVQAYGSEGAEIYNAKKQKSLIEGGNIEQDFYNNRANEVSFTANKSVVSSYFLEDGDFFRINNITLGYNFKNKVFGLENVRLYVTAKNPFLFTDYSGYSPELPGRTYGGNNYIGNSGIDYNTYPTTRTVVGGFVVDF
ncbi:SusC/RagA family TonB-linked outer membrane protein [Tamlana sp. 2201CG12-4]|uniref:SusC/RagA family TonB-linked outer membrane protein n=1 Tax=Tamlana sp. 2201CG12-4 TaxID=3112582 RepID=UPI002DB7204E|nr:SusC/RagA family TonB-linked outer membrane protein [Tamlana sp. 2201CG12-4]MEC3905729.1 SusC/RagA family TonB-linked outer membrane protein [Tamlana sp. 2201CG12-4]